MNDLHPVHVTFTCAHCGTTNELTAAHLHAATIIHCSHCATAIAPLATLDDKPAAPIRAHLPLLIEA
jgi:transcription elongation factor Elf1